MADSSLLARFSGSEGQRLLLELLKSQTMVAGNATIAEKLRGFITLRELSAGDLLVRQGATDNDLYFILLGTFHILVNDRQVATRGAGHHVGEMVALNPALTRTATVIAVEPAIVACLSEGHFSKMLEEHPQMWRPIALELSRRLDQRRQFHKEPNKKPIIFIGSSSESLPIAEAMAAQIPNSVAHVRLWSIGVFGASKFPIEDLEAQVQVSDFAVLVCSRDDQVISRGEQSDAPRDNVVFELGLFMGALTRHRTFLLVPLGKPVKLPSDLLGLKSIRYKLDAHTPEEAVHDSAKELLGLVEDRGAK
jgi:predicted nucleotide-binding protein